MADYEFVPKNELKRIEQEVIALKSHPILHDEDSKKLQAHMEALHLSMERMLEVFKKASSDMELEEREDKLMTRHLDPLKTALNELSGQNETIAEGIVSVQDRIDVVTDKVDRLGKQHDQIMTALSHIEDHIRSLQATQAQQAASPSFEPPTFAQQSTYLQEQPASPFNAMQEQAMQPLGMPGPAQNDPMSQMTPPPPAGGTNNIPPLEANGLGKKKKKKSFLGL